LPVAVLVGVLRGVLVGDHDFQGLLALTERSV
jgi:hypothetical protein